MQRPHEAVFAALLSRVLSKEVLADYLITAMYLGWSLPITSSGSLVTTRGRNKHGLAQK